MIAKPVFLESLTPGDLRQGDVVYSYRVPYWNVNTTQHATAPLPEATSFTRAMVDLRSGGLPLPLLVLSHDCELENVRARLGLLVAPIVVAPNVDDGTLKQSTHPVGEPSNQVYEYGHLWPMQLPAQDPVEEAAEPIWMVADFSGITTVAPPSRVVAIFRKIRRFEMTDEARQLLQDKVAAYFLG